MGTGAGDGDKPSATTEAAPVAARATLPVTPGSLPPSEARAAVLAAPEGSAAGADFQEFEGYKLVRLIGRGGMGEVYLAHDTVLDRPVAVKFIAALEPGGRIRERFLREARAIARLQHPNVVAIYRAGEVAGLPYLVSELVRGGSLDKLPLPLVPAELLRVCAGLASGLAAAHRGGVLHRDLKPANALLCEDGDVKLCDFGLAKLIEAAPDEVVAAATSPGGSSQGDLTRQGAWLGTPRYMAPEIWRHEPATVQSDLYSLGAMFYQLASGHAAIAGTNVEELRAATLAGGVTPLAQLAPAIDPRFCALVTRLLQPDPAARPVSSDEVYSELTALTRPLSASSAGKPSRRRRRLVALLALLATLAVAVTWATEQRLAPTAGPHAPSVRLLAQSHTAAPGWTVLTRFRHEGRAHALAYDAASGRVRFERLGADGQGGQTRWTGRWPAGFSHIVAYEVGGQTFLIAYDQATGLVRFEQVRPDLQGALLLGAAAWPKGSTLVTPFVLRGRNYVHLYDESNGQIRYELVNQRGSASTVAYASRWSREITAVVCYTMGDQAYLVAYKGGFGEIHYDRVTFAGLGVDIMAVIRCERGLKLALLDAPGPPRLLAYAPASGAARVLTLAPDGSNSSASPPVELSAGATAVVPFAAPGSDVLLYDAGTGRLETYELSRL